MEEASKNSNKNESKKESTLYFGELRNDTEFITKSTNLENVCIQFNYYIITLLLF